MPDKTRGITRFCHCYNQKQKKTPFAAFRFSNTGHGHKPKKLSSRNSSCLERPFRFWRNLATTPFQPCVFPHGFFRFHARNPCWILLLPSLFWAFRQRPTGRFCYSALFSRNKVLSPSKLDTPHFTHEIHPDHQCISISAGLRTI